MFRPWLHHDAGRARTKKQALFTKEQKNYVLTLVDALRKKMSENIYVHKEINPKRIEETCKGITNLLRNNHLRNSRAILIAHKTSLAIFKMHLNFHLQF